MVKLVEINLVKTIAEVLQIILLNKIKQNWNLQYKMITIGW